MNASQPGSPAPAAKGTATNKKVADLEAALVAKTNELAAKTADVDTLKGQHQTLSKQKADAESAAKRNGLFAIIAAIAVGLMTFLFIQANSAKEQATSRIADLQGQLEVCNKKPSPAPILPATPAPATGEGSCVTQETHVTVNGVGSSPASSPSVKVEKKQKSGQSSAPAAKPAASAPPTPVAGIPPHGCMYTSDGTAILKGQTTTLAPGVVIAKSTFADINASEDKAIKEILNQFPNWKTDLPQRLQMCAKWSDHKAEQLQEPKGRALGKTTLIK